MHVGSSKRSSGNAGARRYGAGSVGDPCTREVVHTARRATVLSCAILIDVGKRKTTENKTVGGTVKKEELKVEKKGDVDVKGDTRPADRR